MRTIALLRFLAVLLVLFSCLAPVRSAADDYINATYYFSDVTSNPLNVRRITVTYLAPSIELGRTNFSNKPIYYPASTYYMLTNGSITLSNLLTGYALRVAFSDGYSEPAITNYFGTNLSGTVFGNDYKTTALTYQNGSLVQWWYANPESYVASATLTNIIQAVAGEGGGTVQTNISYTAVTNLTSFGALTNNETRAVQINNTLGVTGTATMTAVNAVTLTASSGISGPGTGLTAIPGAQINTGTISSNKMDATAHVAYANDVTQAGLAAGTLPINGALATNLINTSSTYGRSIKANEFPFTFMTIQSNAPLRVLEIGDSVTAAHETAPGLRLAFNAFMPFAGFGSIYNDLYNIGQAAAQFQQSGGLSQTASDSHTTQYHFHLSNGQQYISSGTEVLANKLSIYYYADGAAGTMLVETQALGGSYGTLATINSASGTAHITTNFTLSSLQYYRVRITSTGNNYLLDVGLHDTSSQRSHTWATKSTAGDTVTNIVQDPAFWKFFTNYNPHLIIIEAKDPAHSILPAMDWFRQYVTNSDVIYVAPSPNSSGTEIDEQCDAMFQYARTNIGISIFDKKSLFNPTNYWIPIAYLDSAHLNYKGVTRASQAFADWFNVDDSRFSVGGKTNVAYFSVLDARLISAAAIQTTVPELLNEVYYGGSTLWHHGFRMNSGGPRAIGIYLPNSLILGKKTIAISQRWLTTNAQLIAHSAVLHRLSFDDINRREKVGSTGGNILSSATGTNLVTYRAASSFTQPCRDGDYIFCELGHGGTLTNSIFWMGAKVEAY